MKRSRHGFTLVELLLVVMIIAILAAVIIPKYEASIGAGRAQSMSASCQLVQEMIEYHHARGDVALSPAGYPLAIDPTWFQANRMPTHTWTGRPIRIQIVAGAANAYYPLTKTFDPTDLTADNAWYNTTNGSFCILIGPEGSDAETIETFNEVNGSSITALNQTTK